MWSLILCSFLVQTVAISADELYFHLKRGLPRWERIGHPLDTFSVVLCFLFVLIVPYSAVALKWYIGCALLSCALITKDEWVHKHHCPATEQWLHALLFINHPILLTALALLWPLLSGQLSMEWLIPWQDYTSQLRAFLIAQTGLTATFMLYQIIYWNFIWQEKKE